jgi:hypothetical protein
MEVPASAIVTILRGAINDTVYTALSDKDGRFSFGVVPAGIYVLRIDGGKTADGRVYESSDFPLIASDAASHGILLGTFDGGSAGSCWGPSFELRPAFR